MITLNLIPKEQKKEIKIKRINELVKKTSSIIILFCVTAAIVIFAAKIILKKHFADVVEQTSLIVKNNQSYDDKINNINSKIETAANIQKGRKEWSFIVEDLANNTAEGILLSSLAFDGQKIAIKGNAKFRDNLLSFKKNLENSSYFKNIVLPLQNLLQNENINFEINAELENS